MQENDADLVVDSKFTQKGKLYVGNRVAAEDQLSMQDKYIRVVVSCIDHHVPRYDPHLITLHEVVLVPEAETVDLSRFFVSFSNMMERALSETNVLVHCEDGRGRSATLVAAFLMRSQGYTMDYTLTFLKQARPQICPNNAFRKQL